MGCFKDGHLTGFRVSCNLVTGYYQTAGVKVFPKVGKIVLNEQSINVRPKTFELLMMLITSKETVSKQQILNEIWDDVVVDDQVIFQSVKELRKLFSGQEVIKTYPRKGYAWVADVKFYPVAEEHNQSSADQVERTKGSWSLPVRVAFISPFLIIFLLLSFHLLSRKEVLVTGSVAVLPIENNIEDSSQQWVRYGAMDQLVQRLSSSDNVGVLNTDYVFEVMKRAGMPKAGFERDDIEQMFVVSGTTFVVESSMSGSSGDYKLIYNLHTPNDIERGVILEPRISVAIDKLAEIVNKKLGNEGIMLTLSYQSAFANQMLAEAIQMKESGDNLNAKQLLEAIAVTEPDNLTAQRLLTEIAVENVDITAADTLLAFAIPKALETRNIKELVRLRFFAAMNAAHKGDVELSQQLIEVVKVDAESINDWLYLAYASEFTGFLNQSLSKFDEAKENFEQAISYHQVLRCPLGQSNGLMHLAVLAHTQGDLESAKYNAEQSLNLIEARELFTKKPSVESWLQRLETGQLK